MGRFAKVQNGFQNQGNINSEIDIQKTIVLRECYLSQLRKLLNEKKRESYFFKHKRDTKSRKHIEDIFDMLSSLRYVSVEIVELLEQSRPKLAKYLNPTLPKTIPDMLFFKEQLYIEKMTKDTKFIEDNKIIQFFLQNKLKFTDNPFLTLDTLSEKRVQIKFQRLPSCFSYAESVRNIFLEHFDRERISAVTKYFNSELVCIATFKTKQDNLKDLDINPGLISERLTPFQRNLGILRKQLNSYQKHYSKTKRLQQQAVVHLMEDKKSVIVRNANGSAELFKALQDTKIKHFEKLNELNNTSEHLSKLTERSEIILKDYETANKLKINNNDDDESTRSSLSHDSLSTITLGYDGASNLLPQTKKLPNKTIEFSVLVIQVQAREMLARKAKRSLAMKKESASVVIQSFIRMKRLRTIFLSANLAKKAALIIQRFARHILSLRKIALMRKDKFTKRAAHLLQNWYRKFLLIKSMKLKSKYVATCRKIYLLAQQLEITSFKAIMKLGQSIHMENNNIQRGYQIFGALFGLHYFILSKISCLKNPVTDIIQLTLSSPDYVSIESLSNIAGAFPISKKLVQIEQEFNQLSSLNFDEIVLFTQAYLESIFLVKFFDWCARSDLCVDMKNVILGFLDLFILLASMKHKKKKSLFMISYSMKPKVTVVSSYFDKHLTNLLGNYWKVFREKCLYFETSKLEQLSILARYVSITDQVVIVFPIPFSHIDFRAFVSALTTQTVNMQISFLAIHPSSLNFYQTCYCTFESKYQNLLRELHDLKETQLSIINSSECYSLTTVTEVQTLLLLLSNEPLTSYRQKYFFDNPILRKRLIDQLFATKYSITQFHNKLLSFDFQNTDEKILCFIRKYCISKESFCLKALLDFLLIAKQCEGFVSEEDFEKYGKLFVLKDNPKFNQSMSTICFIKSFCHHYRRDSRHLVEGLLSGKAIVDIYILSKWNKICVVLYSSCTKEYHWTSCILSDAKKFLLKKKVKHETSDKFVLILENLKFDKAGNLRLLFFKRRTSQIVTKSKENRDVISVYTDSLHRYSPLKRSTLETYFTKNEEECNLSKTISRVMQRKDATNEIVNITAMNNDLYVIKLYSPTLRTCYIFKFHKKALELLNFWPLPSMLSFKKIISNPFRSHLFKIMQEVKYFVNKGDIEICSEPKYLSILLSVDLRSNRNGEVITGAVFHVSIYIFKTCEYYSIKINKNVHSLSEMKNELKTFDSIYQTKNMLAISSEQMCYICLPHEKVMINREIEPIACEVGNTISLGIENSSEPLNKFENLYLQVTQEEAQTNSLFELLPSLNFNQTQFLPPTTVDLTTRITSPVSLLKQASADNLAGNCKVYTVGGCLTILHGKANFYKGIRMKSVLKKNKVNNPSRKRKHTRELAIFSFLEDGSSVLLPIQGDNKIVDFRVVAYHPKTCSWLKTRISGRSAFEAVKGNISLFDINKRLQLVQALSKCFYLEKEEGKYVLVFSWLTRS